MIKVLLADDESLMRAGLRMILESADDLEIVAEAADGIAAVDAARRLRPDVALMDIRMPRMDGLAATRSVLALPHPPAVIILTTFDADDYLFQALEGGACGFLLKDTSPHDLLRAVRLAHDGGAVLSPGVTRRLIEEFAKRPGVTGPPAGLDELTDREREVLVLMARGLSNGEIARSLYVAETTVKTHVGRVLQKLRLRDRAQAVVLAYESGLVQPGS